MKSIYQLALGERYERLHPKLQEKFGLTSTCGRAAVSHGTMEEIRGGWAFLRPFFYLGTKRRMIFPERGRHIPFRLENYAYRDSYARECVIWARTFQFPTRTRHFDAVMVYSRQKKGIVDYFGSHQDFVSDLELIVLEDGGLRIVSTGQCLLIGQASVRLPVWLRADADVTEHYDEDAEMFSIHVRVRNPLIGTLFEYAGRFRTSYIDISPGEVPSRVKPVKERSLEGEI